MEKQTEELIWFFYYKFLFNWKYSKYRKNNHFFYILKNLMCEEIHLLIISFSIFYSQKFTYINSMTQVLSKGKNKIIFYFCYMSIIKMSCIHFTRSPKPYVSKMNVSVLAQAHLITHYCRSLKPLWKTHYLYFWSKVSETGQDILQPLPMFSNNWSLNILLALSVLVYLIPIMIQE